MATAEAEIPGDEAIDDAKKTEGENKSAEPESVALKSGEGVAIERTLSTSTPANMIPGPPIIHPTVTTWQWMFSASDMPFTPSVIHSGMSMEQEKYNRWKGVQLICRIGEYLRVGNQVTSTASAFFHRFYMRRALVKDPRERAHDTFTFQEMSPTCIFLACKVEETYRKLHYVVESTMAVMDRSPEGLEMVESRAYRADIHSKEYGRWKDLILLYEERLLETLCFDLVIQHPQPIAIKACKRLGASRDMAQLTVVLLNSIAYGAVCTFYDAATLAAGAFQKACNLTEIDPTSYTEKLGTSIPWYEAFDVDAEEVEEAMSDIEEQLAYHNERLSVHRVHVPAKSQLSTPNAQVYPSSSPQHNVLSDTARTPVHIPTESQQQKHLHFASQETVIESKSELQSAPTNGGMAVDSSEGEQEGIKEAGYGSGVQQEERTDAARPISRHGSKGTNLGPPPPLSLPDSRRNSETKESSIDPHKEAVAQKVQQEQIQQEETAVESEEEGAL